MTKVAIITGLLLILVGVAGYGTPLEQVVRPDGEVLESKANSWTALIPALVGLPILLCGIWSAIIPGANKTAMHVAASLGLLGALAATVRGLTALMMWIRADDEFNARAFVFVSLMAILCWMFVAYCVASFIRARKNREQPA